MKHLTTDELEAGLAHIVESPKDGGKIELLIRRPADGEREILETAEIDEKVGVVGDNWLTKPSKKTPDRTSHPDMQINIMNARAASLLAVEKDRWQLAGDQIYVDMDLSYDNLPVGTQLQLGTAIVEVTAMPHLGCAKFANRFGKDALRFVNSEAGRKHNLRGINVKVIRSGEVSTGQLIEKIS